MLIWAFFYKNGIVHDIRSIKSIIRSMFLKSRKFSCIIKIVVKKLLFKSIFIKLKEVKEKVELRKFKDLFFLCNYENGAVVYVDNENVPDIKKFLNGEKGSNYIKDFLDKNGFFDGMSAIKQAYLHVTDYCNMNCIGCYSKTESCI